MKICKIVDCVQNHHAKGLCGKHYARQKRLGSPNSPLAIKQYKTPEERWEAWTEWQGDCLIWTGATSGKVEYGRIWIEGHHQPAHVYAWEREHGEVPVGLVVDHKDHCSTLCCNVNHLRLATQAQNNANQAGTRKDNKSGYRGVSWCKVMNKWDARVQGKSYGYFDCVHEAGKFIQEKRKELFGEFAGKG